MPADRSPYWSTEGLLTNVLDLAARLGWPAVELSGGTVGPGEAAWGAWAAAATGVQLSRAIGVLTARTHRERA